MLVLSTTTISYLVIFSLPLLYLFCLCYVISHSHLPTESRPHYLFTLMAELNAFLVICIIIDNVYCTHTRTHTHTHTYTQYRSLVSLVKYLFKSVCCMLETLWRVTDQFKEGEVSVFNLCAESHAEELFIAKETTLSVTFLRVLVRESFVAACRSQWRLQRA